MTRPKPWRVRVRTAVETWVEVEATSPAEAEVKAAVLPNVLSVFGRSAIPANQLASASLPEGVQE